MDLKEKKKLAVFSYGLPVLICILVFFHVRKHGWAVSSYLLLAMAMISLPITMLQPMWLQPLYQRWMKVAHFIGSIVTALCLSIIFYCIFAPVGILLRLLKKDFLDRSWNKQAVSYWSKCESVSLNAKRYTQQF